MMAEHLLLIPPDTRPPTLDFPMTLARASGAHIEVPGAAALPELNRPGDYEALSHWLRQRVAKTDTLIVCLETLCLGGMIPARRVNTSLEQVLERLELLRTLKRDYPTLKILAFGVIVRVAHGNDPLEEKPFYAQYGPKLRAYSEAFDRHARHQRDEDAARVEQLKDEVPEAILREWLTTRERNHKMHQRGLELVAKGVIDHLCLTLDDTSQYGLAAQDRRALEAKTDALGLWPQVDIYPGADEVPVTLLARALQPKPSCVYVRYSGMLGPTSALIFEDRPAGELVKAQLRAAGCIVTDELSGADFVLAVNTPGTAQAHGQPDFATVDTAERHLPEFLDFIIRMQAEGKPVSIADIAYPNGAEVRLVEMMRKRLELSKLAGFGGWNTAGNTLGGAIAMGALHRRKVDHALWTQILMNRLVDDYLYQGIVRRQVDEALGNIDRYDLGDTTPEAERLIDEKLTPLAHDLWQEQFASTGLRFDWRAATLAWPRLFTGVFPFTVTGE